MCLHCLLVLRPHFPALLHVASDRIPNASSTPFRCGFPICPQWSDDTCSLHPEIWSLKPHLEVLFLFPHISDQMSFHVFIWWFICGHIISTDHWIVKVLLTAVQDSFRPSWLLSPQHSHTHLDPSGGSTVFYYQVWTDEPRAVRSENLRSDLSGQMLWPCLNRAGIITFSTFPFYQLHLPAVVPL